MSRFQFVWWPERWWRLYWSVWRPTDDYRFIYRWAAFFGPLEIRRWETRTVDELWGTEEKTD